MLFKEVLYLELWRPFCLAEQNHLCNIGREHHEEQFNEVILNLDQWFRRRCSLKTFLTKSSSGTYLQTSGPIFAILVDFGPVV